MNTDISKEAIALLNAKTCAKIGDGYTLVADEVAELLDVIKAQGVLINALEGALNSAKTALDYEPEYHDQGMGCGLEDRNITDRYEAMSFGWESAMERVTSETIQCAIDDIDAALKGGPTNG